MDLLYNLTFLKLRLSEQYYKGYKELEDMKHKTPLGNTSGGFIPPILSSPHQHFLTLNPIFCHLQTHFLFSFCNSPPDYFEVQNSY